MKIKGRELKKATKTGEAPRLVSQALTGRPLYTGDVLIYELLRRMSLDAREEEDI